ncbi:MAG: hypothetical protein A4S14_08355 [Proteobacteria bacterium SG_bin9]|nr:MAG: hypothetical protein A4S14_08355 [Proteobacteria bacterium SG_bin9]
MSSLTTKLLPKFLTLTATALALSLAPAIQTATAAPAETPATAIEPPAAKKDAKDAAKAKDTKTAPAAATPAPATSDPAAKPADKKSSIDNPAFVRGYRAAYATIFERNDYAGAIVQLRALDQDNHADVANLIGYSYRKLGNFEESKNWYERALRADPNHVKTWQYYGLWQVEQGNRQRAMDHLNKIGSLCGFSCPEYQSLGEALATTSGNY